MAFTIKSLPQEQQNTQTQVQPGTQVGGFTVKSVPQLPTAPDYSGQSSIPFSTKAGVGLGTVAGLGAMKLGGKVLESAGKFVYGLNLPPAQQEAEAIQSYRAGTSNIKPKTTIETAIESPLFQKGGRTISSKFGMMGTRAGIGTQAESKATGIFTQKINPIMQKADQLGISFDYKSLIDNAKKNITNSAKRAESQKKSILQNIDELAKGYKGSTTLKNLDLEKQAIANKIPQKFQTMPKPSNELKAAQKELAGVFRNKVHSTIQTNFGVDSAKLYQDYANLKGLSKIGPKALTEAGRKGGAGTFLSWVTDELATPITTTLGKLGYKAGKLAQKLPDWLVAAGKNTIKKMGGGMAGAEFIDPNEIRKTQHQSFIKLQEDALRTKNRLYRNTVKEVGSEEKANEILKKNIETMKNNPPKEIPTALIDLLVK